MCHESTNQMNEVLNGMKPSNLTKGLKLLAMNQDKNFLSVDKRFESVEVKLDLILDTIKDNKSDTDGKIDRLQNESTARFAEHKKELAAKFKEIDNNTEVMNFFSKHPVILKIVGMLIIGSVLYGLGHVQFFEQFLKLK